MIKDAAIKATHDADTSSNLEGVFLFDMINFIKRWVSTGLKITSENINFSFAQALFLKVAMKSRNLVLLKIPTWNLPTDQLRCRVQDIEIASEYYDNNGDTATNQKHYTRRKKTIEYIFQDSIPVEKFTKIGEIDSQINCTKSKSWTIYREVDSLDLLGKLLVNQPEEKAVNLAKKSSFDFVNLLRD